MAKKAEAEFLFGDWLTERIKTIASGANARIAAAFWSVDGIKLLFGSEGAGDARILCDIAMGATSPKALELLGAPKNKALCHHERLHAKVFISDLGLIVGSANASAAALGAGGAAGWLLEAGTFHPPGSEAWKAAIDWFDPLFERSPQIGKDELARAALTYRPPRAGGVAPAPRHGSLLDLVRAAPERFSSIGFVLTDIASDDDEVSAARKSAKKLRTGFSKKDLEAWPRGGVFTGWDAADINRWPKYFVELWLKNDKLVVYGRRAGVFDPGNGSILSRSDWAGIKRTAGLILPDRSRTATVDRELALLLHRKGEGTLFANGDELARRLAEIEHDHPARSKAWTADPSGEREAP